MSKNEIALFQLAGQIGVEEALALLDDREGRLYEVPIETLERITKFTRKTAEEYARNNMLQTKSASMRAWLYQIMLDLIENEENDTALISFLRTACRSLPSDRVLLLTQPIVKKWVTEFHIMSSERKILFLHQLSYALDKQEVSMGHTNALHLVHTELLAQSEGSEQVFDATFRIVKQEYRNDDLAIKALKKLDKNIDNCSLLGHFYALHDQIRRFSVPPEKYQDKFFADTTKRVLKRKKVTQETLMEIIEGYYDTFWRLYKKNDGFRYPGETYYWLLEKIEVNDAATLHKILGKYLRIPTELEVHDQITMNQLDISKRVAQARISFAMRYHMLIQTLPKLSEILDQVLSLEEAHHLLHKSSRWMTSPEDTLAYWTMLADKQCQSVHNQLKDIWARSMGNAGGITLDIFQSDDYSLSDQVKIYTAMVRAGYTKTVGDESITWKDATSLSELVACLVLCTEYAPHSKVLRRVVNNLSGAINKKELPPTKEDFLHLRQLYELVTTPDVSTGVSSEAVLSWLCLTATKHDELAYTAVALEHAGQAVSLEYLQIIDRLLQLIRQETTETTRKITNQELCDIVTAHPDSTVALYVKDYIHQNRSCCLNCYLWDLKNDTEKRIPDIVEKIKSSCKKETGLSVTDLTHLIEVLQGSKDNRAQVLVTWAKGEIAPRIKI